MFVKQAFIFLASIAVINGSSFGQQTRMLDSLTAIKIQSSTEYRELVRHYSSVVDSSKWDWAYQRKFNFDAQHSKCNIESLKHTEKNEVYCYAPDRKSFIDIFGGCEIYYSGNSLVFDSDVDNAVILYTSKDASKQIIIGFGAQPVLLASDWISNSRCAIFGLTWLFPDTLTNSENPPGQFELFLCDVKKKTISVYSGPIITMIQNRKIGWYRSTLLRQLKEKHPELRAW